MDTTKWICTDPDNDQYRLDEDQDLWIARKFNFKQGEAHMEIDIDDYTVEEILNVIEAFGYSGNGQDFWIFGTDKDISNDIIAECMFEHELNNI